MADVRAFSIRNFASVSSVSFFSVTVEDFQHTSAVCGLDIVLIRSPDRPPIFSPAHIHSLATRECDSKGQWFPDSEHGVIQLSDEASRFCEKQWWLLDAKMMVSKQKQTSFNIINC